MSYPFENVNEAYRNINYAFNEFQLARYIAHPNIVEYKCFVHTYDAKVNKY
jgi:hypothetical protein